MNSLEKYSLKKDGFHVTSEAEKLECSAVVIPIRFAVIPNFVKVKSHSRIVELSDNENIFKMIFLSRIHPKKGLEETFELLSKLEFNWNLKNIRNGRWSIYR